MTLREESGSTPTWEHRCTCGGEILKTPLMRGMLKLECAGCGASFVVIQNMPGRTT